MDTYFFTKGKNTECVDGSIKIYFYDPIIYNNNLIEVFPNINVTKLDKKEYTMQIYYNLVKGMARYNSKKKIYRKDKNKFLVHFCNGINTREITVSKNKIVSVNLTEYPVLNESLAYIVAQFLYENIERLPFTLKLDLYQENIIKKLKYYISNCYESKWQIIRDYLTCNSAKLEKRVIKRLEFNNLSELEKEIKRI